MSEFKIALQLEDLSRSKTGSITAPIWLQHGEFQFPCVNWSDFPVVILGWWLASAESLRQGTNEAAFMFMDGPFEFHVSNHATGFMQMRFVERHAETDSLVKELLVPFSTLQNVLIVAANNLATECTSRGWEGSDISTLKVSLSSFIH